MTDPNDLIEKKRNMQQYCADVLLVTKGVRFAQHGNIMLVALSKYFFMVDGCFPSWYIIT